MGGFQIDEAIMHEVVTAAIVKAMTEESKALLIQEAVASLLKPAKKDAYSHDKTTVLQGIFEQAVYKVAHEEVEKSLRDNAEVKELFQGLIAKALAEATNNGEIVGHLASALSQAFARASRY